jgi:hypothetical protein
MATFRTYAEVLRPDHTTMKLYEARIQQRPPGIVLQDILRETGGAYETTTELSEKFREDIREVAELTSDEQLLRIADLSEVPVSLEHLRQLDPQTRIVMGCRLDVTLEESKRLGRRLKLPPDPKTTVLVEDYASPGAAAGAIPANHLWSSRTDMNGRGTAHPGDGSG